jgi:hypothetical protein
MVLIFRVQDLVWKNFGSNVYCYKFRGLGTSIRGQSVGFKLQCLGFRV